MKNILKKIVALFTACSCVFTIVACDKSEDGGSNPPPACSHTYVSQVTKEATCGESGVKTFTCSLCEDSYTEEIEKTDTHHYIGKVTKEATCAEKGEKTFTCSVCGDSYTESIARTDDHDYVGKVTKSATCAEKGEKTFTCSVCGDSYTENIAKTDDHDYVEKVTKEATCTEEGLKAFTCSVCGDSYTEEFPLSELSASEVFELSKNSIGEIITYDKSGDELALGTGFVYSSDGRIITNYHVIEDAYSAQITIAGNTYTIKSVLAYDKTIDLVVLKIEATGLSTLDICANEHAVGKTVYAFGSSKGLTATFSQGIITCADRELDGVHYVQHDAAISGGNSGGPLINQYAEIIGINTMTIKDSQNLNFAISAKEIANLTYGTPITIAELYEKEHVVSDPFTNLKTYIKQNGTYDSSDKEYTLTLGSSYSSDYSSKYTRIAYYDVVNDEVNLALIIDSDYFVMITIDELDGVYDWGYTDYNDNYMLGTLYATTYTSSSLLGYSYHNMYSSSLITSVRKLASAMVALLASYMDSDFSSIGVTAYDLGFYYF